MNKLSNGLWDSVFKCMADSTNVYGLPLFVCLLFFWPSIRKKGKISHIYWAEDGTFLLFTDVTASKECGTSRAGLLKMKNVYAKFGTFRRTRDL